MPGAHQVISKMIRGTGVVPTAWCAVVLSTTVPRAAPARWPTSESVRAARAVHDGSCSHMFATVEATQDNPEVAKPVAEGQGRIEQVLYERLVRAQSEGELAEGRNAQALARFILNHNMGLMVLARRHPIRPGFVPSWARSSGPSAGRFNCLNHGPESQDTLGRPRTGPWTTGASAPVRHRAHRGADAAVPSAAAAVGQRGVRRGGGSPRGSGGRSKCGDERLGRNKRSPPPTTSVGGRWRTQEESNP